MIAQAFASGGEGIVRLAPSSSGAGLQLAQADSATSRSGIDPLIGLAQTGAARGGERSSLEDDPELELPSQEPPPQDMSASPTDGDVMPPLAPLSIPPPVSESVRSLPPPAATISVPPRSVREAPPVEKRPVITAAPFPAPAPESAPVSEPVLVPHFSPIQNPASRALQDTREMQQEGTVQVAVPPRRSAPPSMDITAPPVRILADSLGDPTERSPYKKLYLSDPASDRPIGFFGEYGVRSFDFDIPSGARFNRLKLNIAWQNGLNVSPEDSRFSVYVQHENASRPLWLFDLPLNALSRREFSVDLPLDDRVIRPGQRNQLIFEVAMSHRVDCSLLASYELWAHILPNGTSLEYELAAPIQPRGLAQIEDMLSSSLAEDEPLLVLLPEFSRNAPGVSSVRDAQQHAILWGANVAQGYGLALKDRPPLIEVGTIPRWPTDRRSRNMRFPGIDQDRINFSRAVLVGTRDMLSPYLSDAILDQIRDATLLVAPLDTTNSQHMIVISGMTENQVDHATRLFAEGRYRTCVNASVSLGDEANCLVATDPYSKDITFIEPGRAYSLREFGYRTRGFNGTRFVTRIPVYLPPDLFVSDDRRVRFLLRATYADDLHSDATLNIWVNPDPGTARLRASDGGVELNDPVRQVLEDHPINLPFNRFHPGLNFIEIEAKLPQNAPVARCRGLPVIDLDELPPEDGTDARTRAAQQRAAALARAHFVLYEDSTITFPDYPRLAELPDLRLFGGFAYPYSDPYRAGGAYQLVVPNPLNNELAAAFTLSGKLAQQAGHRLSVVGALNVGDLVDREVNSIIVGKLEDVARYLRGAPISHTELADLWSRYRLFDGLSRSSLPEDSTAPSASDRDILALGTRAPSQEEIEEAAREQRARRDGSRTEIAAVQDFRAVAAEREETLRRAPPPEAGVVLRFRRFLRGLFGLDEPGTQAAQVVLADDRAATDSSYVSTAVLMQYRSQRSFNATWVAFTADNSNLLKSAAHRLATDIYWSELTRRAGDYFAFGTRADPVFMYSRAPQNRYYAPTSDLSSSNLRLITSNWFSRNLIDWIVFILFLIFLLGITTWLLSQRLGQEPDIGGSTDDDEGEDPDPQPDSGERTTDADKRKQAA